jgi:hypothetical protein
MMMQRLTPLLTAFGLLAATGIQGQADVCTSATLIGCGQTVNGTTVGFNPDVAPFCGTSDGAGPGVWFRFVGNGQNVTLTLCTSTFDTRVRVYTGSCGAPQCVAGNDDGCGVRSMLTFSSQSGFNYFILVHGFGAAAGAYTLQVSCAAPAPVCYSSVATVYAADPFTGTQLTLSDDVHSPLVPIGFPFCFNGITYTSCVISSNNYVSFNPGNAGTYSPWATVAIPNVASTALHNSVMAPWQDIHPGMGGQVRYQTLGTAPNRRFVVSYLNVPMYSCWTQLYTSQTVLFEGSNCLGTFITSKPVCSTWNGGSAVHGVQNGNGSSAQTAPGRNNTAWTATMQGMFFSPTCGPCSTATSGFCMPALLLPVELTDLVGRHEAGRNVLQWTTASEQNSMMFVVERSTDLEHFIPIATVAAAGQSQSTLSYSAQDDNPEPGTNYYRLRMVDNDGEETFSDVLPLVSSAIDRLVVYPNPCEGSTRVLVPKNDRPSIVLTVHDMTGREVMSLKLEPGQGSAVLSGLAPGTYLVMIPELGSGATTIFQVM